MAVAANVANAGLLLLVSLAHDASGWDVDGCTSIIVSSRATVDGSAITSHANDCADCDWRMVHVPAKDHSPGATRIIYDGVWDQYPRLVDPSRSKQYTADVDINSSRVLGSIPEVEHTYAMWEASYSLMNEHGLAMGESTCPAYLYGKGPDDNGTAIFTIGNLMSVALERCKTARCAVRTMGDLGARYGFYGEDPAVSGGGEAVTIVDNSGEAWVFHIAGGLPDGDDVTSWKGQRGALWIAQRVPDGHVAVVANSFIIQKVDRNDHDNFMYHPGLFDLTKEAQLWDGIGEFNFQRVMAPDLATFSYFPGMAPIPMYSTLRMWGIFRHSSPSLDLQPSQHMEDYPFSVPVDNKVSHLDVMNWFRDHYEGTEFDMRLGALAGPWQSPNRMEGGLGQKLVPGQFARGVSIPRTSYTVVLQSGIEKPVTWFAPDAAASSVFVPFFSDVLANGNGKFDIQAYGEGSMKAFDFGSGKLQPAWWAFDFVANWMELSYKNMSEKYVYPRVQQLQEEVAAKAQTAARQAAEEHSPVVAASLLGEVQTALQRNVTEQWWQLAGMLVVRYNDGFLNFPEENKTKGGLPIGYPAFWLEMLGYNQQCFKPTWVQPAANPPDLLPLPALDRELPKTTNWWWLPSPASLQLLAIVFTLVLLSGAAGFELGKRASTPKLGGDSYLRLA